MLMPERDDRFRHAKAWFWILGRNKLSHTCSVPSTIDYRTNVVLSVLVRGLSCLVPSSMLNLLSVVENSFALTPYRLMREMCHLNFAINKMKYDCVSTHSGQLVQASKLSTDRCTN